MHKLSVVTCVYCGHEYPDGTPTAKHDLLTAHIKVCEKHPMREAEARIERLRGALSELIGAETKEDLEAMEAAMRMMPPPSGLKDMRAALAKAIAALGDDSIPDGEIRQQCKCGSTKDLWFSRVEPMGYFCADCGEQDAEHPTTADPTK